MISIKDLAFREQQQLDFDIMKRITFQPVRKEDNYDKEWIKMSDLRNLINQRIKDLEERNKKLCKKENELGSCMTEDEAITECEYCAKIQELKRLIDE